MGIQVRYIFTCDLCCITAEVTMPAYLLATPYSPILPAGWDAPSTAYRHYTLVCPKHKVAINITDRED